MFKSVEISRIRKGDNPVKPRQASGSSSSPQPRGEGEATGEGGGIVVVIPGIWPWEKPWENDV